MLFRSDVSINGINYHQLVHGPELIQVPIGVTTDVPVISVLSLASLDGTNGIKVHGGTVLSQLSGPLHGIGDFNGDGFDDVIFGAPAASDFADRSKAGVSYVLYGRASGLPGDFNLSQVDGANGLRLDGHNVEDYAGHVSSAGDVNGDGLDDLLVGAPGADPGGRNSAGATYVVFGTHASAAIT